MLTTRTAITAASVLVALAAVGCEKDDPAEERAEEIAEQQAAEQGLGPLDQQFQGEKAEKLQELKQERQEQNQEEGFIDKPLPEEGEAAELPDEGPEEAFDDTVAE